MKIRPIPLAGLALWCGLIGSAAADQSGAALYLDVYKSPTCGCCVKWVAHLSESGFASSDRDANQLAARGIRIPAQYGSCHTAVSQDGYAFEGHVPARYIRQFLNDPPPGALGLAVPAMPIGSPGMEYKDLFEPYDILLLKKDGSAEVYVSVESYAQQFD
ncbi:MAG TPA: DUF411 domain-containing protein [Pseudomonadales bacterium]